MHTIRKRKEEREKERKKKERKKETRPTPISRVRDLQTKNDLE